MRFVEVKSGDRLRRSQWQMFEALERLGIIVEVWDHKTRKLSKWREYRRTRSDFRDEAASKQRSIVSTKRHRRYRSMLGV